MLILVLKTIHVLGAVLFLGTGLGSAYYKFRAGASKDARVVAWCDAEVVRADWIFTVPAGLIMPVSGLWPRNSRSELSVSPAAIAFARLPADMR